MQIFLQQYWKRYKSVYSTTNILVLYISILLITIFSCNKPDPGSKLTCDGPKYRMSNPDEGAAMLAAYFELTDIKI